VRAPIANRDAPSRREREPASVPEEHCSLDEFRARQEETIRTMLGAGLTIVVSPSSR
jgi:hypothetical protein